MGTSSLSWGPGNGTPLVPTWLEPDGGDSPGTPDTDADGDDSDDDSQPAPAAPVQPIPQPPPEDNRFRTARINFSRFARTGGLDRASFGRALSSYVTSATGGARQAARRMGSARTSSARLLGFLADAQSRGAAEALRALNLESLAGLPIEEIFLGIADFVCPDGGTIDEGISRNAFIETIADLAGLGITDFDALTASQVQTVFELHVTHAIEGRICNDIGLNGVTLPVDVRAAERVQAQLRDFIRRGVADAMATVGQTLSTLTPARIGTFGDQLYEAAFNILCAMGQEAT